MRYTKLEEKLFRDLEAFTYRELEAEEQVLKKKKRRVAPIILYDEKETDFNHNGLGVLSECLDCIVTESLEGEFELELTYPLQDSKGMSELLQSGRLIRVNLLDSRLPQVFRIRRTKGSPTSINVYAQHIALADLSHNFISDINIVDKTRLEALDYILKNTHNREHNFFSDGDDTSFTKNIRLVRCSPIDAIGTSQDNSLLSRFGGEIEFDNFCIRVVDRRGTDTAVLISHRKNITGVDFVVSDLDLVTRIIPQGAEELLLPEYFIDSPHIHKYDKIYYKHIVFDEVKVATEDNKDGLTISEAHDMLRKLALAKFSEEKVDEIKFDLTVDFEDLSVTEEYREYASLEAVNIGDTVIVRYEPLGIDIEGRVYAKKFDGVRGKNKSVSLGFRQDSLSNIFSNTNNQIGSLTSEVTSVVGSVDSGVKQALSAFENKMREEISQKADKVDLFNLDSYVREDIVAKIEELEQRPDNTEDIKKDISNLTDIVKAQNVVLDTISGDIKSIQEDITNLRLEDSSLNDSIQSVSDSLVGLIQQLQDLGVIPTPETC